VSLEKGKAPMALKVVLLAGCGHWVQQELPAEVNAETLDFLRHEYRR
jgi:pimeloyl-ACP methyl ester carboxylesterase